MGEKNTVSYPLRDSAKQKYLETAQKKVILSPCKVPANISPNTRETVIQLQWQKHVALYQKVQTSKPVYNREVYMTTVLNTVADDHDIYAEVELFLSDKKKKKSSKASMSVCHN